MRPPATPIAGQGKEPRDRPNIDLPFALCSGPFLRLWSQHWCCQAWEEPVKPSFVQPAQGLLSIGYFCLSLSQPNTSQPVGSAPQCAGPALALVGC